MLTSLSRSVNNLRVWAILFCLRVLVKFSSTGSFPAKADQHNPIRAARARRSVRPWGFGPPSRRGSKHGYILLSYSHAFRDFPAGTWTSNRTVKPKSGQLGIRYSEGALLDFGFCLLPAACCLLTSISSNSLETSGLQFVPRQGARGRQFHLDAQSQPVSKLLLYPGLELLRLDAGLIL